MKLKNYLLMGVSLLVFVSCEEQLTPPEVTDEFWNAIQHEDTATLRKHVSKESSNRDDLGQDLLTINSWSTGKITIDGDRSEVETEITITREEDLTVTIKTYLVDEGGYWKVDYPATVNQINNQSELGQVLNRLDDISEQMLEGLDQSIEKFQEAMPVIEQELTRIEETLREKVPEIKKRLDEFARKLEEALKQRKKPPVQEQPVEI